MGTTRRHRAIAAIALLLLSACSSTSQLTRDQLDAVNGEAKRLVSQQIAVEGIQLQYSVGISTNDGLIIASFETEAQLSPPEEEFVQSLRERLEGDFVLFLEGSGIDHDLDDVFQIRRADMVPPDS